jgi:hypothetical protein
MGNFAMTIWNSTCNPCSTFDQFIFVRAVLVFIGAVLVFIGAVLVFIGAVLFFIGAVFVFVILVFISLGKVTDGSVFINGTPVYNATFKDRRMTWDYDATLLQPNQSKGDIVFTGVFVNSLYNVAL